MEDYLSRKETCSICREEKTSIHAEIAPGRHIYVCEKCLETAKQNFIWICMSCGSVYIRPKSLVLRRLTDPALRRAYQECEDQQIIQGIDRCIECDPAGVVQYVAETKCAKNAGHC